jgi:hypothetical protein
MRQASCQRDWLMIRPREGSGYFTKEMLSYASTLLNPASVPRPFGWYRQRAMTETVFNKVVHLILAATAGELKAVLGSLPHGIRLGVAHQLEMAGEAFRYESLRHCAYYLRRQPPGFFIWRWCYIASQPEANRLQAAIASLQEPLSADGAGRAFEQATGRSAGSPRPAGLPFHALDFSNYPSLHVDALPAAAAPELGGYFRT